MEVKNLLDLYDLFEAKRVGPVSAKVLQQLQEWGLLAKTGKYKCRNGHLLKLSPTPRCSDGWYWRCYGKNKHSDKKDKRCFAEKSIRTGTIFEKSHLSIFQILTFSYLWIENIDFDFIKKNVEISQEIAVKLNKSCLQICAFALAQNNVKLEDEIYKNEFHLNKRKKYFRDCYEKFFYLNWCNVNNKNSFIMFMKYAGLLHNPLCPKSYEEQLPYLTLLVDEEDCSTDANDG